MRDVSELLGIVLGITFSFHFNSIVVVRNRDISPYHSG